MDPLAFAASVAVVAGTGAGWRLRRRARSAGTAALRDELAAGHAAASHDPLTGLPDRRAFHQLGAALVADPEHHPLVAVVLDLDDFKQINDDFGHEAGDEVLVTIARRFADFAGENLVARLGGDEFAGLISAGSLDGGTHPVTRQLADLLAAPMSIAGGQLSLTASIGLVPVRGCADLTEALHRADAAMYRAKNNRGHALTLIFDAGHPEARPTVRTHDLDPHATTPGWHPRITSVPGPAAG